MLGWLSTGSLRFAFKPLNRGWLFHYFLGKKFESNRTGEFQMLSPVHNSHSTPSQDFQNPITKHVCR